MIVPEQTKGLRNIWHLVLAWEAEQAGAVDHLCCFGVANRHADVVALL